MISEVVARELQISRGWTREFVDKLAPYYLATLTHMSRGHATPVFQVIDEVWHAHILCTRDYADFCARHFGRFIHHERTDGAGRDGAATDFFRDYGLSLTGLQAICGATSEEFTKTARCSAEPPPGATSSAVTTGTLTLARCSQPEEPPRSLVAIARCSQPAPEPPRDGMTRTGASMDWR